MIKKVLKTRRSHKSVIRTQPWFIFFIKLMEVWDLLHRLLSDIIDVRNGRFGADHWRCGSMIHLVSYFTVRWVGLRIFNMKWQSLSVTATPDDNHFWGQTSCILTVYDWQCFRFDGFILAGGILVLARCIWSLKTFTLFCRTSYYLNRIYCLDTDLPEHHYLWWNCLLLLGMFALFEIHLSWASLTACIILWIIELFPW